MNPLFKYFLGDYSQVGLSNKQNRHNWIKQKLKELPAGFKILDAGAGELQFKPFCSHLNYTSQDFAQYDGKGDGIGIQTEKWDNSKLDIVSDITNIPVESNTFDVVFCSEVLHHLPHPVNALKELVRVLKPNGQLIITAPFASLTHFAPYHFSSGFNKYFYEYWMKEFNCDITELTYNGNYFEFVAQEVRYAAEVAQKYSSVKMTLKEKLAQRIFLAFLQKNSKQTSNAKELLAFTMMIVAKKKQL
jgi:ubiquinone/menaquinone biosynthesis C-methylase UbiE